MFSLWGVKITYISRFYNDKRIDVNILSAKTGFSISYFQHLFTAVTGFSVMNYVRKQKLQKSLLELSTSDKNIIEIAMDFGFEYEEVFIRAFKREFGISPGKYRKLKTPRELKKYLLYDGLDIIDGYILEPRILFYPEQILGDMDYITTFSENRKTNIIAKKWNKVCSHLLETKILKDKWIIGYYRYELINDNNLSS